VFCCWSVVPGAPAWPPFPGGTGAPGGPGVPGGGTPPPGAAPRVCNPARGVRTNCAKSPIKQRPILDQMGKWTAEFVDEFLFDDIRKLQDPNVSAAEKALIIASYAIPVPGGPIIGRTGRVIAKKMAPLLVAALKKAERQIAKSCSIGAAARAVAAANCRKVINKLAPDIEESLKKKVVQNFIEKQVLQPGGELIGKKKGNVVEAQSTEAKVRQMFDSLTHLGEKVKNSKGGIDRETSKVPGGGTWTMRDSKSRAKGQVDLPTLEHTTGTGSRKKTTVYHFYTRKGKGSLALAF
jgi:hypothetical protein